MSWPEIAEIREGEGLSWAVESCPRITKMGARGMAIESYREFLPKSRREGRGRASTSYQKMVEMM
jgi:hypothetical protein